jgi:transposase-like protein
MIEIKPTPVNNLLVEPYKVNEIEPVIIKEGKVYLDSRLSVNIYCDLKEIMEDNYKCIYVDNIKTNCDCNNVFSLNGPLKRKVNKLDGIYVQQYICSRCGKTHVAKPAKIPKYHCYEENTQESVILMHSVEHNSLRHMSELLYILNKTNPSHQTVKNYINKLENNLDELKVKNISYSGNYGYDEQYIYINGEKYYIFALIDVDLRILVDFKISKTLEKKAVEEFIQETTKNQPRISLTTDGKPMYKYIARKLGFKHKLCLFHLMKEFSKNLQ